MNTIVKKESGIEVSGNAGFVGEYLLYLLASASDVASAAFHAQVRARGLRVPEWRILACLIDTDGQMVTELAQLSLFEQSRLTKIVDQMAIKGLVKRRSDDRDRRRVRVHLTPEGRRLGEELVEAARRHERTIVEQMRPGEAALLKQALKRIHALCEGAAPAGATEPGEPTS
ncbi:MarR family winged helix-turn-helix transcriptional regulator [Nitratireductor pacificus]|uniref:MarR family transcriptional regulator n=1 Tax=Nitratireductor pacificus pht-3B TaxID=391937 RepID=K2MBA6_9HYPH|nr:MarR family winged helix-turn-helix transcriptional regulator [Nitratireductor pacificus]EKF18125.1 MarR family transcriptional regulator [Nitratireductor pacificus pht-3B]